MDCVLAGDVVYEQIVMKLCSRQIYPQSEYIYIYHRIDQNRSSSFVFSIRAQAVTEQLSIIQVQEYF